MRAEIVQRTERVLRIQKLDSMGRSKEQIEAMEANQQKPPKLGEGTLEVHAICAAEHSEYPKCMYHRAVRNGIGVGDEVSPAFPMPLGTAECLGLDDVGFKVIGRKRQDGGHIVIRHSYITRLVGVVRDDLTIDVEAARPRK